LQGNSFLRNTNAILYPASRCRGRSTLRFALANLLSAPRRSAYPLPFFPYPCNSAAIRLLTLLGCSFAFRYFDVLSHCARYDAVPVHAKALPFCLAHGVPLPFPCLAFLCCASPLPNSEKLC
jgi:hypothetical protein